MTNPIQHRIRVSAVVFVAALVAGCAGNGDGSSSGTGANVPTATATMSPIPTGTATPVPSNSPAAVPTHTATTIPSATSSPTSTRTSTATASPTRTDTVAPSATPSATSTRTDTPSPTPTVTPHEGFVVRSSVLQLLVSDANPGAQLAVRDAGGSVLQSGTADAQGTLIFRDIPAGDGYVVFDTIGSLVGGFFQSPPTSVWAVDQPAANEFYTSQQVVDGYQYVTMRDGTLLAINVYLPGPIDQGPYPTVIEYSGYDPANPDAAQPGTSIATTLGYAAVGVNMRGTGCSGGSFKFFEPAQVTDGYDVVEIIAQQPWVKFNKVGMVGISYPGISQLFVAQSQPPHLAAITPLSVIPDTVRGTLYPGGILNNGFATDWASQRQADAEPFGQAWAAKRRDQGDQVCVANQRFRGQNPNLLDMIHSNKFYDPKIGDPLAPVTFVDKINVPVFLAGSWQDEQTGGYFPTMIDHFTGTDKLHFTMTNGGHVDSLDPAVFTRFTEFLSFYVRHEIPVLPAAGKAAMQVLAQQLWGVKRVPVEADRFVNEPSFEAALAKFEAEPKIRVLYESGAGGTQSGAPVPAFEQTFEQWPIASVQPTAWYLDAGGRLSSEAPAGEGADSYTYDPSHGQLVTFGGSGGDVWKALPSWTWLQPDADKAAVYETEALTDTLVMTGSGSVDLWLKSTATDTDLQVSLSEVRPDGNETYVQSGWLRASFRAVDPVNSTELRPAHTLLEKDSAPLPAGEYSLARVELFPFAHVFRAGSRLRLIVDSPGGTRPLWKFDTLVPDGTVVNSIGRSPATPSRVVLPVVPGITPPTALPACPSLRFQYCRPYQPFTNTAE